MLKWHRAPLSQPLASSTLPENHVGLIPSSSLFWGQHLPLPGLRWWLSIWTCIHLAFFVLFQYSCAPRRAMHPAQAPLGPHPQTSALEMFCGGLSDATTTRSLFIIARLHFPSCYLCFHTSNVHSTHLKMTPCGPSWVLCHSVIDFYYTRSCWFAHKRQHALFWCFRFSDRCLAIKKLIKYKQWPFLREQFLCSLLLQVSVINCKP